MNHDAEFDIDQLNSRNDFRLFLEWLADDLKHNSAQWENDNLQSFLEALIAYTDDVECYYKNMRIEASAEKPSWRLFADILCGARIYE